MTTLPTPVGGVWAMRAGDFYPTGNFASTNSGIQQALDYAGVAGEVYLCPGTYSSITNLTMYNKQTLRGAGPLATLLVRSAAATGITLREKTAGEGNSNGATGIVVRDLSIYGNGSSGDGIVFGIQGGSTFTSNAYLSDVLVRDFLSGTGVELKANAIHSRDVWSLNNNIGFYIHDGGACHWDGFWAEACVLVNVRTTNPWDTWTHLQLEQNGRVPSSCMLEVGVSGGGGGQASGNKFLGLFLGLETGNATNLVIERTGVTSTVYIGIQVNKVGHTYTNTIYDEVWAAGTGARDRIAFRYDTANSERGIFYDKSTNSTSSVIGNDWILADSVTTNGVLTAASTQTTAGNSTITGGNVRLDNSQSLQMKDTGGTYRYAFGAAGGSDNIRIKALSGTGQIQFNNFADTNNNLVITDAGAVTTRSSLTVGNLTNGKYPKIGAAGLLTDGPTPLAGTKVYYVSDTSGGAVTRKLTFTDGILTAET